MILIFSTKTQPADAGSYKFASKSQAIEDITEQISSVHQRVFVPCAFDRTVQNPQNRSDESNSQALSHILPRIARRTRRTRLVRALKKLRKPFPVWPIIAGLVRPFRTHSNSGGRGAHLTPSLKKPLPAWSMLILLLLGIGIGFYASTVLNQAAGQSNPPDFTIGVNPPSMTVVQGNLATFTISLDSLNGFAGSVNLNASVSPRIVNSTSALNPASVSLFTGTGSSTLTVQVPSTSSVGTYRVMIEGAAGKLGHNVTALFVVTAPPLPDFLIQASPAVMNVTQGSAGSSTITLTSIGGFTGIVNLTDSISPSSGSSPTVSLNPNRVTLLSGGTANVVLTVSTSGFTFRGSYLIVVQGVSGTLSNTVTISLRVQ